MRSSRVFAPLVLALHGLGCSSASPAPAVSDVPASPSSPVAPITVATATAAVPVSSAAPDLPTLSLPIDDIARENQFAARLYRAISAKDAGNVFLSPPSLRLALGMAFVGANGTTAEEIAKATELAPDPLKTRDSAKSELAAWRALAGKDVELSVANRLWGEKSRAFEKSFLDDSKDGWGSALEPVDFVKGFEPSRLKINAWVKKETGEKIAEILPRGSLDDRTRLVITNAVYFKAKWSNPFAAKSTAPGPWMRTGSIDGKPLSVSMMHQMSSFGYAELPGLKALELRYGQGAVAMVVLLPEEKDGLAKLEARIDHAFLASIRTKLAAEKVEVSLPSFELSYGGSMKTALEALGMVTAFSAGADFEKISKGGDLHVTDVFHKTFVHVDESGTEAAAATGIAIGTKAMILPKTFVADHPFLFYVHDTKTGRVLFIGRLVAPTAHQ